jgi:maltose O-acetyltransferase
MAYGKKPTKYSLLTTLRYKFFRSLISSFPLNPVRVWGLRMCGFEVGKKVYIGQGLLLTMPNYSSNCHLIIEDRVAIAPRVTFILASDANWSRLNEVIPPVEGRIVLKEDCWLGAGSILLPNVTIGTMSVVGAGSVVTKDVPSYIVVAGAPAVEIKKINP